MSKFSFKVKEGAEFTSILNSSFVTLYLFAIEASFLKNEIKRYLLIVSKYSRGARSISNATGVLEANLASGMSKNLFLQYKDAKEIKSTLWSFAACLATFFDKQLTAMIS